MKQILVTRHFLEARDRFRLKSIDETLDARAYGALPSVTMSERMSSTRHAVMR